LAETGRGEVSEKPYSVPKEGLFMPKGKMKQSFPKSYPIEEEVINQE
jgi:hypothetical protein